MDVPQRIYGPLLRGLYGGNHDVKLCRCVAEDYKLLNFLHKTHTETLDGKINWKTMNNIVQHLCTNVSHVLRIE